MKYHSENHLKRPSTERDKFLTLESKIFNKPRIEVPRFEAVVTIVAISKSSIKKFGNLNSPIISKKISKLGMESGLGPVRKSPDLINIYELISVCPSFRNA